MSYISSLIDENFSNPDGRFSIPVWYVLFIMSSKHPKRKISLDEVTDEKYYKFTLIPLSEHLLVLCNGMYNVITLDIRKNWERIRNIVPCKVEATDRIFCGKLLLRISFYV